MQSVGSDTQSTVWIGLGSNEGEGREQIDRALAKLEALTSVSVSRVSSYYRTRPWGLSEQREFTNAVAEISVNIGARQLLRELKTIEETMGRKRGGQRWGPRCIDLDLLLMDQKILFLPALTIPHPRMHLRAFVLIPIFELEPDLLIPARGSVRSCLARIEDQGVSLL